VVIAAPHTTNWDLPMAILVAFAYKKKMRWMGKDSLFRKPFGWFFQWLAGIPVDRSRSHGMVDQMVQRFHESEELILVMAPEGTRTKTKSWRSGFYHIAYGARVPIVLCFLDYGRKTAGIGPVVIPSGDIDSDMKTMRTFFEGITGKRPELSSDAVVHAVR
jgi:1-acyl-sn-glycerol-3-phosphate acyltransferase